MNDEQFATFMARVLAMRDVVARLLAYEAERAPDKTEFLREISDATDERIHRVTKAQSVDQETLALQEKIRREIDWLVAAARKMTE
jgi:hypothetical protein